LWQEDELNVGYCVSKNMF